METPTIENCLAKAKKAEQELKDIPWWRTFKRQDAGWRWKTAMIEAAILQRQEEVKNER